MSEIIETFGLETGATEFLKVNMLCFPVNPQSLFTNVVKRLMIIRITATLSLALSKISILVLCRRVFTDKWFRLAANCTNALIVLW